MNIAEMHVWFRQYAQQMGMQNVRAILPEQIDLLINTSISDTINQLIRENIGVTNDRIITDNSKIGQINAFRTLYKVIEIDELGKIEGGKLAGDSFTLGDESFICRLYAAFNKIDINNNKGTIVDNPTNPFSYMFLVDLSINYKLSTSKKTNWYPVRLIDDAFLADTLNDFILKPKFRSPISVIYNEQLDLYIDTLDSTGNLPQKITPSSLRISYISKPAKVQYLDDIDPTKSVSCDLPESMHVDILKHAVDLYRISVSGSLSAVQQQEDAQNRENVRNNYRNEGTQQQQR